MDLLHRKPDEPCVRSPAGAGMDLLLREASDANDRFPRRRGDGPRCSVRSPPACRFPPQARGWTQGRGQQRRRSLVSPAGAGMDRPLLRAVEGRPRFPRRRGDGPEAGVFPLHHPAFPPQARGWTSDWEKTQREIEVSPAGAGMDRRFEPLDSASPGFPRRRGDGPRQNTPFGWLQVFPPQARGWTSGSRRWRRSVPVSPAGAGMDLRGGECAALRKCFPRRRGDGPRTRPSAPLLPGFPPQARGWTPPTAGHRPPGSVSPAGAGMDPGSSTAGRGRAGFPRRRGEDPGRRTAAPRPSRFPRRRGDGPGVAVRPTTTTPFPPQARGWTLRGDLPEGRQGVSPAGAGMDPTDAGRPRLPGGFPRRRGDGPGAQRVSQGISAFPPQAPGWTVAIQGRTGSGALPNPLGPYKNLFSSRRVVRLRRRKGLVAHPMTWRHTKKERKR